MYTCFAGGDGDFFHASEAAKTTLQDIVVYGLLSPKDRCGTRLIAHTLPARQQQNQQQEQQQRDQCMGQQSHAAAATPKAHHTQWVLPVTLGCWVVQPVADLGTCSQMTSSHYAPSITSAIPAGTCYAALWGVGRDEMVYTLEQHNRGTPTAGGSSSRLA